MEEIYIPLARKVSDAVYETVDTFSSFAEALSVPVMTNKEQSFIAVSKHILKKITKQQNDMDNLFHTLKKVTLNLVVECLRRLPVTNHKKDRLPSLTHVQKQAAEKQVRTFDDLMIGNIKHQSTQIRAAVENHKGLLKRAISAQKICWKEESILSQAEGDQTILATIESHDFLHKTGSLSDSDLRARDNMIEEYSSKLTKMTQAYLNSTMEYKKKVSYEDSTRERIKMMSEKLCDEIRLRIAERLSHGIDCLRDCISEFSNTDKRDECFKLIEEIDVEKIVYSLLLTSSEKYVCPRVKEYNEIYGFHCPMPVGVVVRGLDQITVPENGIWDQPLLELTKTQKPDKKGCTNWCRKKTKNRYYMIDEDIHPRMDDKSSTDVNSFETLNVTKTGEKMIKSSQDCNEQMSREDLLLKHTESNNKADQKIEETPLLGLVPMKKSKVYIIAPKTIKERAPGLLKLKKGLKIKQKIAICDVEVSFGWCRPHFLSSKVWGFYFKHLV